MKKTLLYAFAAGTVLLGASATAAVYSAQETKAAETTQIAGFVPATGSEVKSISTVTVRFEVGEIMYNSDESKVAEITLTKQGSSESVSATSFGEPTMSMDEMYFEYPVNFSTPVTEAGRYTLSIPEGVFFETEYDSSKDAFVKKEGGIVNAAATATYVVNPAAQVTNSFSKYLLTPESGSTVKEIEMIQLTFENFDTYDAFYNSVEGKEISFTNGSTDYKAYASQDWGYEEGKRFNIFPMDAQENPVTITETGEWYLYIQEGAFSYNGEESPEIMASFVIGTEGDSNPDKWTADPANGGTSEFPAGQVLTVTFTFDNAKSVSYDQANDEEVAGIRVSYNGTTVKEVANALGTEEANNGWQLYQNYGDNCAILRLNYQIFNNTPGILAIEIDEGRFTIDGIPSPAINYTCTFGEYKEYTYNILPSSDDAQTDLRVFTISFPEAETATLNESLFYATFGNAAWTCPGNPTVEEVTGAAVPTFTITFSDNPQKPGTYTLMIDEGSFLLDGKQPSKLIKENYSFIKNDPVDWTWTPSPDGDLVIESWGIFPSFKFTDNENLSTLYAFNHGTTVVLNDVTLTRDQYSTSISYENNTVNFEITDPSLIKPGTLTITLPAESIGLRNEYNKEPISHTWNIVEAKDYTYVLTPDAKEPVSSLSEITIAFPEAKKGEIFNISFISFKDKNYNWLQCKSAEPVADAECATFKMVFDVTNVKENTPYTLSIRNGAFTLDGSQESPEVNAVYTYSKTTGIMGIAADADGKYTVVDINGRIILNRVDASELRNLAKGIYIINGKKQIIK